ncbi:MAG: metallophosphoesterase [Magnetococcales bacterium]|nr:metallophosphoesterase [Magnetococcales bacterium]MBF0114339.1 metallophosphoesterase [Magnetococcales bacterium]
MIPNVMETDAAPTGVKTREVTMLASSASGPTEFALPWQNEWNTSTIWDRIRIGFQEALRHLWVNQPLLPPATPADTDAAPSVVAEETPLFCPPETATLPLVTAEEYRWTLVLSDTDNDLRTVIQTLWLTGLCDQNGTWIPELRHVQVIHTGDWLNKWDPNPYILDGFKRLQETAPPTCRLLLLNGNHELAILQMADKGLRTALTQEDLAFIRRQPLLHFDNETLYLHGYPTLELLMVLKQLLREQIPRAELNNRLHKLLFDGEFPLFRETGSARLIGDIKSPKYYYNLRTFNGQLRGKQAAALLQALGIHTVIHGHKPNNAVQCDQELSEEVPGIRFVNNDNRIRQNGWGGMLLDLPGKITFINPQTLHQAGSVKSLRKQLRKMVGTRKKDLTDTENHRSQSKTSLSIAA